MALGAFHGINPGMGWLFAVALGMQERRRSAVWRAMLPLTSISCGRVRWWSRASQTLVIA